MRTSGGVTTTVIIGVATLTVGAVGISWGSIASRNVDVLTDGGDPAIESESLVTPLDPSDPVEVAEGPTETAPGGDTGGDTGGTAGTLQPEISELASQLGELLGEQLLVTALAALDLGSDPVVEVDADPAESVVVPAVDVEPADDSGDGGVDDDQPSSTESAQPPAFVDTEPTEGAVAPDDVATPTVPLTTLPPTTTTPPTVPSTTLPPATEPPTTTTPPTTQPVPDTELTTPTVEAEAGEGRDPFSPDELARRARRQAESAAAAAQAAADGGDLRAAARAARDAELAAALAERAVERAEREVRRAEGASDETMQRAADIYDITVAEAAGAAAAADAAVAAAAG